MSGGHFEYNQFKIQMIYEEIESIIENNNNDCPKCDKEIAEQGWANWHSDCNRGRHYEPEIIERFKEAVKALKIAHVYAQRVDWLLSDDDGEESFLSRLDEELKKIMEGEDA